MSKTDQFYNDTPTVNDQVHVLVSVIDVNTLTLMADSTIETFQSIRDDATDQGETKLYYKEEKHFLVVKLST